MSVVMSMEEDWQLCGMSFTSRLKLSSWELKNGNAWVDTTASQVSMVEMNMEMSSVCLDASAVQVSPLLSTSENEWSMKRNDLWKHCTSWALSSNSCKCNSSKSYAIQPIFSPKQVHHLSILSCKSHHESLSSCPPNLLSNFIHHQPRPKPISWTADNTRILTTDSDSPHQSPFRTPLLNQTLFSSLISFTVEQIRKVKPFLHCTLHCTTAQHGAALSVSVSITCRALSKERGRIHCCDKAESAITSSESCLAHLQQATVIARKQWQRISTGKRDALDESCRSCSVMKRKKEEEFQSAEKCKTIDTCRRKTMSHLNKGEECRWESHAATASKYLVKPCRIRHQWLQHLEEKKEKGKRRRETIKFMRRMWWKRRHDEHKEQRRVSGDIKGSRERSSTEILMRGERSAESREKRRERRDRAIEYCNRLNPRGKSNQHHQSHQCPNCLIYVSSMSHPCLIHILLVYLSTSYLPIESNQTPFF